MRIFIIATALVILLCGQVSAVDLSQEQSELFGIDELEKSVPQDVERILDNGLSVSNLDFSGEFVRIIDDALDQSSSMIKSAVKNMISILSIVIMCRFIATVQDSKSVFAASFVGSLAITISCAEDLQGFISLGKSTINDLSVFSAVLMPVMASAASSAGAITSAGSNYAVTVLFSNLLIRFCNRVMTPLLYSNLAISVVDSTLEDHRLRSIHEFISWMMKTCLKTIMYIYFGFLSVGGALSGSSDAAVLKAAKLSISGMVPVVGGIVSDAADAVLTGAGLLKNSIGTFGMLVVLAVFFTPFLKIGVSYLAFRMISALSGAIGSNLKTLLEDITEAIGFLMAMISSFLIMIFLSCLSFMRGVQV